MFDVDADAATGKRRRLSKSGFRTQREAKAAEREARRAHELGAVTPGEVPTVAAFVDEWLAGGVRRSGIRRGRATGMCLRVVSSLVSERFDLTGSGRNTSPTR
jgi:hypothetical protein